MTTLRELLQPSHQADGARLRLAVGAGHLAAAGMTVPLGRTRVTRVSGAKSTIASELYAKWITT